MEYTRPDYSARCVDNLPELSGFTAATDRRVVLLVIDGLGYAALRARADVAPTLDAHLLGSISTVVPSTTAAALTSITTTTTPGVHGIVGQCLPVPDAAGGWREFDVLRSRWNRPGSGYGPPPPGRVGGVPFGGARPHIISKRKHLRTGFTRMHLARQPDGVWKMPSSIAVEVRRALRESTDDIYVYYDGLDTTAHHHGFGEHYDAELAYIDVLFTQLADLLPPRARLVATADHGCVPISRVLDLPGAIVERAAAVGGEDRNAYLLARPGDAAGLAADVKHALGDVAWVFTRDEAVDAGLFGPRVCTASRSRIGDVRIFPFPGYAVQTGPGTGWQPPVDVCGHGSLAAEEMLVPLIAAEGPR